MKARRMERIRWPIAYAKFIEMEIPFPLTSFEWSKLMRLIDVLAMEDPGKNFPVWLTTA